MALPIIKIEEFFNKTLNEFKDHLIQHERICAGCITLRELAETATHPNGVYVFFDEIKDGKCLYVGKVSSRTFAGRLPSHFEPRKENWMNQLSKKLGETKHGNNYDEGLQSALKAHLVVIGFLVAQSEDEIKLRKKKINKFEKILCSFMRPELNGRENIFTGVENIADLLTFAA